MLSDREMSSDNAPEDDFATKAFPTPKRHPLRISLPKPSLDIANHRSLTPTTPQPQAYEADMIEPPPPPRQSYKVKRKKVSLPSQESRILSDLAIPSIEMSEAQGTSSPVIAPSSPAGDFLNPAPEIKRFVLPTPRTPLSRTNSDNPDATGNFHEWDLINASKDPAKLSVPSVYSNFSDSEVSSTASSDYTMSLGGSSASHETHENDDVPNLPFTIAAPNVFSSNGKNYNKLMLSPFEGPQPSNSKRLKLDRDVKWTEEMDEHLIAALVIYQKDPRHEPFKMMPGTAPPLGVCSQVARYARKTWPLQRCAKRNRMSLNEAVFSLPIQRNESPDALRPASEDGASTPTNNMLWTSGHWPRSSKATRRRLRTLCRRNSTLGVHYMRMALSRSPSPFEESSSPPFHAPGPPSSAFSSRDMKVSLTTATAPSMQPNALLAKLTSNEPLPRQQLDQARSRPTRPDGWFSRVRRSQAHQKSQSLQLGLGLQASSFDEPTNRSHLLESMSNTQSLGRSSGLQKTSFGPTLDSPFEVKTAATYAGRSHKRRFRHEDESNRARVRIQDVFGVLDKSERPVMRSRGYSMSAVGDHYAMTNPSTPPSMPGLDLMDTSGAAPSATTPFARSIIEPIPRLGSPFDGGSSSNNHFNTFPRAYVPGQAYVRSFDNPRPFDKRIGEIVAQQQAGNRSH